jgi:hypothetical protein
MLLPYPVRKTDDPKKRGGDKRHGVANEGAGAPNFLKYQLGVHFQGVGERLGGSVMDEWVIISGRMVGPQKTRMGSCGLNVYVPTSDTGVKLANAGQKENLPLAPTGFTSHQVKNRCTARLELGTFGL